MPPRLGRWFSGHYQLIGKLCSRPISYFLDFLQIIFSSDAKFVSLLLLLLILAALDLSCAVWALLVAARRISCSMACGILVPLPGIKPAPPALDGRFLTTGPPGTSPDMKFSSVIDLHVLFLTNLQITCWFIFLTTSDSSKN